MLKQQSQAWMVDYGATNLNNKRNEPSVTKRATKNTNVHLEVKCGTSEDKIREEH